MAATAANVVTGGGVVTIGSDLGYYSDGVEITPSFEHFVVEGLEALAAPLHARRTSVKYQIAFTLHEPTLANIKIAHDITNASTGAGPFLLKIDAPFVVQERALVVLGIVPGAAFVRTLSFDRTYVSSPGAFKFSDYENTKLPVTLDVLWDHAQTQMGDYSDAAA